MGRADGLELGGRAVWDDGLGGGDGDGGTGAVRVVRVVRVVRGVVLRFFGGLDCV